MSEALRIVHGDEAGFTKKPPVRAAEPSDSRDVDSNRLMELLEEIEGLKFEIHERVQRIDAVKQAKSVLMEDAARTQALNRKLAELSRVMGGVPAEHGPREADLPEGSGDSQTEETAFRWHELSTRANLLPVAVMALNEPFRERAASETRAESEDGLLPGEHEDLPSGQAVLQPWPMLDGSLTLGSLGVAEPPATVEIVALQELPPERAASVIQQLEEAEGHWKQAEQAALEARKHFEQSTFELVQVRSKEESATTELLSARQELTTAYQFAAVAAQRRLEAAEYADKVVWWAVVSTALSWAAIVWIAWFTLRSWVPVWGPEAASGAILVALMVAAKKKPVES